MRRTGYEHALWHLAKDLARDRVAAPAFVGVWFVGWLSFLLTLLAPIS
jgi:hypothetical protein